MDVAPVLDRCGDFASFLGGEEDQQATRALQASEISGRPVGSDEWLEGLEAKSGRSLAPKKRGPKPKNR